MSAEAVVLLRPALQSGVQLSRQQAAIERLCEIRERTHVPAGVLASEQLVREHRDRLG